MAGPAMWLGGLSGRAVFTDPVLWQEFMAIGSGFRQQTGKQFPINFAEFASNPAAVKALLPTLTAKAANPALTDMALQTAGANRTKVQRELFGLPAEGLGLSNAIQDLRQERSQIGLKSVAPIRPATVNPAVTSPTTIPLANPILTTAPEPAPRPTRSAPISINAPGPTGLQLAGNTSAAFRSSNRARGQF